MKTFEELKSGDIIYRLRDNEFIPFHVRGIQPLNGIQRFRIFTEEGSIFAIQNSFIKKSHSYTLITENTEELKNMLKSYSFRNRNKQIRKNG